MKTPCLRIAIAIISFASVFVFYPAFAAGIVDYYRMMPDEYLGGEKYDLVQSGGKWIIKTPPDYGSADEPVVDVKNGYIKTVYHGGDGDQERVTALFVGADGTTVLGISGYYNGTGGNYSIRFVEYRNKKWKDVTGSVLSLVSYRMFLTEGYDTAAYDGLLKRLERDEGVNIRPQLVFSLPRTGTTVTVGLHIGSFFSGELKDDARIVDAVRANIKYRQIELNWNMKKGKFEEGKKK